MDGIRGYKRIKGISEQRRLPRLGKIRLGVRGVTKSGKEYPVEKDYFVCPPEFAPVFGEKPKELRVMLPVNDPEEVFPQTMVWYGASRGPKCRGNGERAERINDAGEFEDRDCPCELRDKKECNPRAHLMVIVPEVSLGGVYQIDISSYHSIVDLNSGLDYIQALVGRIAMIPLKLRRVPRETHGSGRKETHYPLQILLDADIKALQAMRESQKLIVGHVVAPPEETNPKMEDGVPTEDLEDDFPPGPSDPPPPSILEKFKAIVPPGTDHERLTKFIVACAGHYKQTEDQLRESAIATPADFFQTFRAWEKKHYPMAGKEVYCPNVSKKISDAKCDECRDRQGCPSLPKT